MPCRKLFLLLGKAHSYKSDMINDSVARYRVKPVNSQTKRLTHFNSLLEFLGGHLSQRSNCYSYDPNSQTTQDITSPFVSSISSLILMQLPGAPEIFQHLRDSNRLVLSTMNQKGMVNFFADSSGYYDIDTLACSWIFLSQYDACRFSARQFCSIGALDSLLSNRAPNGGFYTWFGRPNNNVDFMANLNLQILFRRFNLTDSSLDAFLMDEASNFLTQGSVYYRDTWFPKFMVEFYLRERLFGSDNTVIPYLHSLIEARHTDHQLVPTEPLLKSSQIASHNSSSHLREGRPYFNSSSKLFFSPLLDHVVTAYSDCCLLRATC